VIDGGKGQLSCAKQALKECQALDVILLGIAKGPSRKPGLEQLFVAAIGDEESPEQQLMLPPYSPALHLLQHIRDEAHRFAIAGHRRKRGKSYQRSPLEQVGGIGPKKRQVLLNHFGGLQALSAASLDAIAKVPGISYSLAKQIYNHLHQK
jgi:excinuclease ABC subunit C